MGQGTPGRRLVIPGSSAFFIFPAATGGRGNRKRMAQIMPNPGWVKKSAAMSPPGILGKTLAHNSRKSNKDPKSDKNCISQPRGRLMLILGPRVGTSAYQLSKVQSPLAMSTTHQSSPGHPRTGSEHTLRSFHFVILARLLPFLNFVHHVNNEPFKEKAQPLKHQVCKQGKEKEKQKSSPTSYVHPLPPFFSSHSILPNGKHGN